jgi:endoglucanase
VHEVKGGIIDPLCLLPNAVIFIFLPTVPCTGIVIKIRMMKLIRKPEHLKRWKPFTVINITALVLFSVTLVQTSVAREAPFSRGVNLTNWFQVGSPGEIQFTKYTHQDFENIASLGCDVIRLPINLHFMTGGAPDYNLDPLFLDFLDDAVGWAEDLGLHLILDNHTFDVNSNTDPDVGTILEKVWTQMAMHYRDAYGKLYYEVLNEPHGIDDNTWNTIQQGVIDAIRKVDSTHTIIVGGAGWNSYNNLSAIPAYADTNLIYTFHFYDPFLFTHQGAGWVTPSMEPLSGVPYPYHADSMPALPASLVGTWVGSAYNDYPNTGNDEKVKELLDIAISFSNERQVPIYCGELGVYIPNSKNDDRVRWYKLVTRYLTDNGVAWTMWDYHGGFGIFREGGNGLFRHDLNLPLLEAVGLNTPEQTEFELKPDSTGFLIYSDYIGPGIVGSSYGQGTRFFISRDRPNNDKYCIRWKGPGQYEIIGFDFMPDKDLSMLVDSGYALDLMARGHLPGTSFDMRFLDTDAGTADHPWRISTRIDGTSMTMDGRWHHLHIPLSEFWESGAWESGTWYNQEGKFDWKAVDRFEIVSESGGLDSASLWFDNIMITNLDTARVLDNSVFSDTLVRFDTLVLFDIDVHIDSVVHADTIVAQDSIVLTNVIIYTDTITCTDSIRYKDIITFFSSQRFGDTISYADTVRHTDTIHRVDTLWHAADTVSSAIPIDPAGDDPVVIYPNPVRSELYILSRRSDRLTLELFDFSGRRLRQQDFTGRMELEMESLPEGMYILNLADRTGYSRQFMILKQ